ncbi:MAG: DUF1080 domain-containing protein [Verrucomicrobiota bacterium]
MKNLSSLFCALLISQSAFAAEPNTLTQEEVAEGWVLLFDGKDASQNLRGYKKEKLPEQWVVEDGALCRKGGGDVITKEKYENFEFSIEWKISEGGNSGIMFKVLEADGPPYKTGPEAQIIDNAKGKDAQKSGWMYELYAADKDTTKPTGEWNHFVLKCQKTATGTYKCEHWMNGEKYVEYEIGSEDWKQKVAKSKFAKWEGFGTADAGHICLQDHGNLVWFRNIKILKLDALK